MYIWNREGSPHSAALIGSWPSLCTQKSCSTPQSPAALTAICASYLHCMAACRRPPHADELPNPEGR